MPRSNNYVLEINNTTSRKVDAKKLRIIAEKFARAYKKPGGNKNSGSVSLAIVGPARIKNLNQQYRGLDKVTDVLSFTAENEIIINIYETKKFKKYREMFLELGADIKGVLNKEQKKRLSEYLLYFLFVHGLLHLAGYDDKMEKGRREMIKKGRDFLNKIGFKLIIA